MYFGNIKIVRIFFGNIEVKKIFFGDTKIVFGKVSEK